MSWKITVRFTLLELAAILRNASTTCSPPFPITANSRKYVRSAIGELLNSVTLGVQGDSGRRGNGHSRYCLFEWNHWITEGNLPIAQNAASSVVEVFPNLRRGRSVHAKLDVLDLGDFGPSELDHMRQHTRLYNATV